VAANLDVDRKHFRMAELEQRNAEAGESTAQSLAPFVSTWLSELAFLHRTLGDLDQAEAMHRKSLEIDEKLGRLEGMAIQYGNLGSVYVQRGDPAKARDHWTKARDLYARIGMSHMVKKVERLVAKLEADQDGA